MLNGYKKYLGFLIDENDNSLWVDYTGVRPIVKKQGSPIPLKHLPDGWMETDVKYGRSMKYLGVERSYSNQYKFVKDGAIIVREYLYGNKGTESKLFFVLLRWNPDTGIHELYTKGELDLSKPNDDPRTGVSVNLMEGGANKLLKANEGVVYEIPCNRDNNNAEEIFIDGILLNSTYHYKFVDSTFGGFHPDGAVAIPFAFINFDGDSVGIISNGPSFEDIASGGYDQNNINNYYRNSSNYFFKSTNQVTIQLSGQLKFQNNLPDSFGSPPLYMKIRLQTYKQDNTGQNFDLFEESGIPHSAQRTVNINQSLTLEPNEKVFLMATLTATPYSYFFDQIQIIENTLDIIFNSRNPVSRAYSLTLYDLWKALVDKATDGQYQGDSKLLAAKLNLRVTCGDALRGIDTAVIKTSLSFSVAVWSFEK